MATTVLATQFKSLIVGNGIRQWHSDGFFSRFTSDGTRKTGLSVVISENASVEYVSPTDWYDSARNIDTVTKRSSN